MEDIVPVLYEKIKKMFDGLVSSDEEMQAILNGEKKGTFAELYPMSKRVGKYAAKSLSEHYTEELLPDGILYWNIMERTIIPIMKGVNKIDNQLAIHVQKKLDEEQKIGIKPQETEFQEDRVYDVMNKVSTLTKDNKTDLKMTSKILIRSLVNISNGDIDKFIQKNAEFRANAGMTAKITRKSTGHCCEWCDKIAGTYKYPDVPKDVYRRHDNCECTVEYVCGKVKNLVHSGTEGKRKYVQDEYGNYKLTKEARIAKAKQMEATEEERKRVAREKRINTWEKKKNEKNKRNIEKYENRDKLKSVELPPNIYNIGGMSEETVEAIGNAFKKIKSEYNVDLDRLIVKSLGKENKNVPFQYIPENVGGFLEAYIAINSDYYFCDSLEKYTKKIQKLYKVGTLASNNIEDLIAHEMAHYMTFQNCDRYSIFERVEEEVREQFIEGLSDYADYKHDGAETIAEAFVKYRRGEKLSEDIMKLLNYYVLRYKK